MTTKQLSHVSIFSVSSTADKKLVRAVSQAFVVLKENKHARHAHSEFGEIWTKMEPGWSFQTLFCFFVPKPEPFTGNDIVEHIRLLHKYCLVHIQDSYKVHLNRLKGVELLEEVIQRADFDEMSSAQALSLIWCALSCIHHFYIRLRLTRKLSDWPRRKQAKRAIRMYDLLVQQILPRNFESAVYAIITFYTESKLWHTESLCAELLVRILIVTAGNAATMHAILDVVERLSVGNIVEARHVLRVIHQILYRYTWDEIDDTLLIRMLTMFHKSVIPFSNHTYDYTPLRKGLEVCIRQIFEHLTNYYLLKSLKLMIEWTFDVTIVDEYLLAFGCLLEYAAVLHKTGPYNESITPDIFPLVLQLISSDNCLHSLLGNRVFQFLMDRHDNRIHFDTPKIFFDDVHYNMTVAEYKPEDKAFIRKYREAIHTTLLASIKLHGTRRINLESTYTSMAILVVEVPCGFTAAAIVCLAMEIQESTLLSGVEFECSHRLHATVMSIMSLICWVHKAGVFYEYLKSLISRRAHYAPHLNPPIRPTYQYAQHHILWNKPTLFFEDWEARYGLWKCFRTKNNGAKDAVNENPSDKNSQPPLAGAME